MRIMAVLAAVFGLAMAGVSCPPAQAQTPTLTSEQRSALDLAAKRGALLYAYDQAAWHATDDLMSKLENAESRVGGWIVDGPPEASTVTFFDRASPTPYAVYEARFRNGALVESRELGEGDDRALSAAQLRLIDARQIALEAFATAKVKTCAEGSPNLVVLPPEETGGSTLVYLLTPQPRITTFPLGGHYRVAITAEGEAGDVRGFAKSCLMMDVRLKDGKQPKMFATSHLLDPTPTEIHVFTSLAAHLPLAVVTMPNDQLWVVQGTRIRPVDREAGQ